MRENRQTQTVSKSRELMARLIGSLFDENVDVQKPNIHFWETEIKF